MKKDDRHMLSAHQTQVNSFANEKVVAGRKAELSILLSHGVTSRQEIKLLDYKKNQNRQTVLGFLSHLLISTSSVSESDSLPITISIPLWLLIVLDVEACR